MPVQMVKMEFIPKPNYSSLYINNYKKMLGMNNLFLYFAIAVEYITLLSNMAFTYFLNNYLNHFSLVLGFFNYLIVNSIHMVRI